MSSVFISNVDDYLAPSQACVNPLFSESVNQTASHTVSTNDLVNDVKRKPLVRHRQRRVDRRPPPLTTIPDAPAVTETAKVSMADCLACSGCVTTAETILVEHHSLKTLEQLLATINHSNTKVCMTLSPASLADLWRHLNIPIHQTSLFKRKLATFLANTCQATLVVDANIPLSWSLTEACHEFVQVYRTSKARGNYVTTPIPSIAISAYQSQQIGQSNIVVHDTGRDDNASLPLISATCPAVVCLVETTHPKSVSHLASTKSPMSMAGVYYKHVLKQTSILHFAIMPCHDKKLEASRNDLVRDGIPDVDLVLTTAELIQLLRQTSQTVSVDDMRTYLERLDPAPMLSSLLDYTTGVALIAPELQSSLMIHDDFYPYSSGGYATYIFQYACQELFGYTVPCPVPWIPVVAMNTGSTQRNQKSTMSARIANRSKHYYHVTLYQHADGSFSCDPTLDPSTALPVLSFCTAYGLATLQRILQPDIPYDYVEAMACPSGCLNGGGQIRLHERETPSETRQRVAESQVLMERGGLANIDVYDDNMTPFGLEAQKLLHTRYHVVPQLQFSKGAAAGVAVQDTHW